MGMSKATTPKRRRLADHATNISIGHFISLPIAECLVDGTVDQARALFVQDLRTLSLLLSRLPALSMLPHRCVHSIDLIGNPPQGECYPWGYLVAGLATNLATDNQFVISTIHHRHSCSGVSALRDAALFFN